MSNSVEVHNVSIFGDFNSPSNDGIDIDSSNNTLVQNCHIDTADDGIVPKTTAGALFNLTVHKCWIRSKSCAVKLGSESCFDFSNIVFDDITISESHRGLGIQLRDQGNCSVAILLKQMTVLLAFPYDYKLGISRQWCCCQSVVGSTNIENVGFKCCTLQLLIFNSSTRCLHFWVVVATGSIYNITFSNILINTRYYDPSWWGNSEPIYVTACPRDPLTKVNCPAHTNQTYLNLRTKPNEFPT